MIENNDAIKQGVKEVFSLMRRRDDIEKELEEIQGKLALYGLDTKIKSKDATTSLPKPTVEHLPKIKTFIGKETKQLKDVASHIGVHHLALKKFVAEHGYKVTAKDGMAFVSTK